MSTLKTDSQFQLSHSDCEKFREALQAKATAALDAYNFAKHDTYREALKMLHEAQLEAFQRRADKRREKRRQALDAIAAKDS